MNVIKAPADFNKAEKPWLFLAGSRSLLEDAVDRQSELMSALNTEKGTILNPIRDDWNPRWVQSKDNPLYREQLAWELNALENSDLIVIHFLPHPHSILFLQLGLFKDSRPIVYCSPEYLRKGTVDIVCERYHIPYVTAFSDLVEAVKKELAFINGQLNPK